MSSERDLKFFMARVADQAERHNDVIEIIRGIIDMDPVLTSEERNLLSVAYKALTSNRRTAIRTINAFIDDSATAANADRLAKLHQLRVLLIRELDSYCEELIKLIDEKLLPSVQDAATKVFYEKLKADYYRYSVEFKDDESRRIGSDKADNSYRTAMKIATEQLTKANPQFLGLALNYSVFLYEIVDQKKEAIDLADKTFKEAVDLLDELVEDEYSEATLILQLLKDNVQLWTDEQHEHEEGH